MWFEVLQIQLSSRLLCWWAFPSRGSGTHLILHTSASPSEDGVTAAWVALFPDCGVGKGSLQQSSLQVASHAGTWQASFSFGLNKVESKNLQNYCSGVSFPMEICRHQNNRYLCQSNNCSISCYITVAVLKMDPSAIQLKCQHINVGSTGFQCDRKIMTNINSYCWPLAYSHLCMWFFPWVQMMRWWDDLKHHSSIDPPNCPPLCIYLLLPA